MGEILVKISKQFNFLFENELRTSDLMKSDITMILQQPQRRKEMLRGLSTINTFKQVFSRCLVIRKCESKFATSDFSRKEVTQKRFDVRNSCQDIETVQLFVRK